MLFQRREAGLLPARQVVAAACQHIIGTGKALCAKFVGYLHEHFGPVFEHGTVFVLVAQHGALVALAEAERARADGFARGLGGQHRLQQRARLRLRERYERRGVAVGAAVALLDAGVVVVAHAVGPAPGLPGHVVEHRLEGRALRLRPGRLLKQQRVLGRAPAGVRPRRARLCLPGLQS